MIGKIFISYNHKDKDVVDLVAQRLEIEFGRKNIFYDAWSIQPGDSIIGKMNEGLGDFTTFFFFVSENSLNSKMVSLEWQTALNKAVNNELKFIAIKIDDSSMPAILSDKLYIDLYGNGLDDSVEKMKCVINSDNTYKPLERINNLQVEYKETGNKVTFTIKAIYFAELNPTFAFACSNALSEFSACFNISEPFTITNQGSMSFDSGISLNMRTVQLQRPLRPGQPFVFEIELKNTKKLHNVGVYILADHQNGIYKCLPISRTIASK